MLPGAEGRHPPAGPGGGAPLPAGPPRIAGNGPMWSILPAGLGGVASGTLLPVIRPPTRTPTPPRRRRLVVRVVAPPLALLVAALTALSVSGAADGLHCPATTDGDALACPQASAVQGVGRGALARGLSAIAPGRPVEAAIVWRRSRAVGRPNHGRLVRGVELPAAGSHFLTVDPVAGKGRNPAWRRNGTDRLVRVLLRVAGAYAAAHPDAPRLVVGDLSRPRGGRFGRELGGDGHRSHQNGLDADVFYPRRDGLERVPTRAAQLDRRLAQDLVDRFVRAGAQYVFVGPRTRLRGPAKVVMTLANHDDHLHVRIRPGSRR
jgi:hypothetical protein